MDGRNYIHLPNSKSTQSRYMSLTHPQLSIYGRNTPGLKLVSHKFAIKAFATEIGNKDL